MSHKASGASLGEKKSQKFGCVYYALFNSTMGDTLSALVTVSTSSKLLVDASAFMHRSDPRGHDFCVVRSTDIGYFGSKVILVAINGVRVKK